MPVAPNRIRPIPLPLSIVNDPNPKSRETMTELSGNAITVELYESYLPGQSWGLYADVRPGHYVPIMLRAHHSHDDGGTEQTMTIEQAERTIAGLQAAVAHAKAIRPGLKTLDHLARATPTVTSQHRHRPQDGSFYVHHGYAGVHEIEVQDAATGEYVIDCEIVRCDGGALVMLGERVPEVALVTVVSEDQLAERVMQELIDKAAASAA